MPSFPLSVLPALIPRDSGECLLEASSIPCPSALCPTGRKGVWEHTVTNSLHSQGTQQLSLAPSSPLPQPRPHRRKQVAGNAGRSSSWLRSEQPASQCRQVSLGSVPTPSVGPTHSSALSLIGLNPLLLSARWPPEI